MSKILKSGKPWIGPNFVSKIVMRPCIDFYGLRFLIYKMKALD